MECKVCKKQGELREGTCWDCATAESIIADGTDMYDKGPADSEKTPANTAMQKLRFLIEKGWQKKPFI